MELSMESFNILREILYKRAGLYYEDQKIYYLKKRAVKRAKLLGLHSLLDYISYLKYMDSEGMEFQQLINSVTTNETYFFREFEQLALFGEVLLHELVEEKKKRGDKIIRIWSAACATGEEPYTLAIILREMLDDYKEWTLEIVGSDINSDVLEGAQKGFYTTRSIREVPVDYLEKYFIKSADGYLIKSTIKNMITFKNINFMDYDDMKKQKNVDYIFCRNALIYFDDDSRRKVASYFFNSLNCNGYIFLGHSESMGRISNAFSIKRKRDFIVYQKTTV